LHGFTDYPTRLFFKQLGCPVTFSEMASSVASSFGSEKTDNITEVSKELYPAGVQIFGHTVKDIVYMVEKLNENKDVSIIDINAGCPTKKIISNGDGAGLLYDLPLLEEILKSAVSVSKIPITVKTRKGIDENNITAIKVAKICQRVGVSAITVHRPNH